jgi:hypothetical protein
MAGAVLAVIVIGIVLLVIGAVVQQAELKDLKDWATAREWEVLETPRGGPWLTALPDQGRGEVRLELRARVGTAAGGRPATIAWYTWQTRTHGTDANGHSVTNTRTHHATAYVTDLPRPLPDLAVVQRGLGSSLARSLGLSSAPDTGLADFDEHFRIDTEAGREVVTLLPPGLLEALLTGAVPPFACRAGQLVVRDDQRLAPERIDLVLPSFGRLVDLIGPGEGRWRQG